MGGDSYRHQPNATNQRSNRQAGEGTWAFYDLRALLRMPVPRVFAVLCDHRPQSIFKEIDIKFVTSRLRVMVNSCVF